MTLLIFPLSDEMWKHPLVYQPTNEESQAYSRRSHYSPHLIFHSSLVFTKPTKPKLLAHFHSFSPFSSSPYISGQHHFTLYKFISIIFSQKRDRQAKKGSNKVKLLYNSHIANHRHISIIIFLAFHIPSSLVPNNPIRTSHPNKSIMYVYLAYLVHLVDMYFFPLWLYLLLQSKTQTLLSTNPIN